MRSWAKVNTDTGYPPNIGVREQGPAVLVKRGDQTRGLPTESLRRLMFFAHNAHHKWAYCTKNIIKIKPVPVFCVLIQFFQKRRNWFIFQENRNAIAKQFPDGVNIGVAFAKNCNEMGAREYIRDLAANGIHHFTTTDAARALKGNLPAVRAQLRRLKQQQLIAEPVRSFHVVVAPEHQRLGCPPAEQFIDQLMQFWSEPYYVCLLSAAERHGAAHQRPQATQVMVRKNRQGIECGLVRVEFVARGDLEQIPVTKLNTPRGVVRYSSAEVTALELVGYPGHAGGLSNVATVLSELSEDLSEELSADKLLEAARLCPVSWSQRLGYLLELVGQQDLADVLAPFVKENAHSHTPLRRAAAIAGGKRSSRWKLIVNVEVEPDE